MARYLLKVKVLRIEDDMDLGLALHTQALILRAKRAEILADNLVNADTPGFKARDLSFKEVLSQVAKKNQQGFEQSKSTGLDEINPYQGAKLTKRIATQASVNGNTVDKHREMMDFSENALRYQASLNFLENKFQGLLSAIKGE